MGWQLRWGQPVQEDQQPPWLEAGLSEEVTSLALWMPNTNAHQIKNAIHLLQKLQRLLKTQRAIILVYSARPLNWRGQHTTGSPQLIDVWIDKPLPLAWLMPDADGPRGLLGCPLAIDTTSCCSSRAGLGGTSTLQEDSPENLLLV